MPKDKEGISFEYSYAAGDYFVGVADEAILIAELSEQQHEIFTKKFNDLSGKQTLGVAATSISATEGGYIWC